MNDYPCIVIYTQQSTKTGKKWWSVVLHARLRSFTLERMRAEPGNLFRMSELLTEFPTLAIRCGKAEGAGSCIKYMAKQVGATASQ